jgi:hypothetical protein
VLTEREEEGGGAAERELTGGRKKGVAQLRGSSPEGGRRGRSNWEGGRRGRRPDLAERELSILSHATAELLAAAFSSWGKTTLPDHVGRVDKSMVWTVDKKDNGDIRTWWIWACYLFGWPSPFRLSLFSLFLTFFFPICTVQRVVIPNLL